MNTKSSVRISLVAWVATINLTACGNAAKTTGESSRAPSAGKNASVVLTWDARKGQAADSFIIYGMPTPKDAEVPITSIKASAANFDPKKPSITLPTTDQKLKAYVGKSYCFSVTAVVGGVESASSKPACGTL